MSRIYICFLVVAVLLPVSSRIALACPQIDKLVDFNCDQTLKIAFVGDSVVAGVRDEPTGRGGYVGRLAQVFVDAQVTNLGVPGVTTERLLHRLYNNFRRKGPTSVKNKLIDADVVLVDVGRNDYWNLLPPQATIRNIERIVYLLKSEIARISGVEPFVVVESLIPTARFYQRTFIAEVNNLLTAEETQASSIFLGFKKLKPTILSWDGLHPSARGYDVMAKKVYKFLSGAVKQNQLILREDADQDGVYDYFELKKFGTDPEKRDTDGDGIVDGDELFPVDNGSTGSS